MLPLPYGTDAPVYHLPIVTVGLIAANTTLFIAASQGSLGGQDAWMLEFGQGLHPHEWFLCNFMHLDWIHLIGNMIFLWTFGLIVEGKLGWWRFLTLYLLIGLAFGAVQQTLALGYQGPVPGGMGASAVIFGLVAVALVWAPRNEVHCVMIWSGFSFMPRVHQFEMAVSAFAGIYFVWEGVMFAYAASAGAPLTSAAGHLLGGLVGAAAGVWLFRKGFVDCEGWDIFTLWQGKEPSLAHLQTEDPPPPKIDPAVEAAKRQEHAQAAVAQIQTFLAAQNPAAAVRLYEKMTRDGQTLDVPEPELRKMIAHLQREQAWSPCAALIKSYLQRCSDAAAAPQMRLILAKILLEQELRPASALELLNALDDAALPDGLRAAKQKLQMQAQAALEEADLELEGEH